MAADAITLIQISDCHLPGDASVRLRGVNTDATLAAVLDHVRTVPGAAAVLATGDLANDGSPEAYRRVKDLFRSLEIPVLCLPGNHDEVGPFTRVLAGENVSVLGTVRFGNWHIVLLDSTVSGWEDGRLGGDELERLGQALDRIGEGHALVCLHHHPVPVGAAWRDHVALHDADAFLAVVDRYPQIRGIIWGHIHQPYEGVRHRVRLLGAPATCFQFRLGALGPTASKVSPGYRLLRLFPDGGLDSEAVFLLSQAQFRPSE